MKLTSLIILLLLTPNASLADYQDASGSQQPIATSSAKLQELEARFKQIDAESGTIKVKESSGKVEVSVEREEPLSTIASEPASNKTVKQKKKLLELNLGMTVPDEYVTSKIVAVFSNQNPSGMLPGVKVMQLGASPIYEVVEDYTYDAGAYHITVPKGFRYDRASIPPVFWVIVDKDSLSNVAPLFHDYLYQNGGVLPTTQVSPYRKFSRKETDELFRELMAKCGVTPWRREVAYQAVRNGAAFAWQGH